ncbi:MAG TPA: DUF1499 domain-containing protein [Candidatus Binataceae bacterium]|nr:DUF1499 domain-containing protein [Candidatus Binataceae bacterium]
MTLAGLAFFDALLAITLVLVGIVAAHFYIVVPFLGFQIFLLGFLLSLLAIIFGIIGLILTRRPERRGARNRAIIGLLIGIIIATPVFIMIRMRGNVPAINDITTDFDNPPEFVFALTIPANHGRDMKYDRAKYEAKQKAGYPILAPLKESDPPQAMYVKLKDLAAGNPNWVVTASDPNAMTIEGVSTSKLFHFNDDFIIQVRAANDGGSLVEMRSKSRDGIGDFGINYKRIHNFFDRVALARDSGEEPIP